MDSTHISLGMLGSWEIIMILAVMILGAAAVTGLILLAIWLSMRARDKTPASAANETARLATCPRCGNPLPMNAPQGLCPRCVMQVGIGTQDSAEPAFRDSSGKPNPPDPEELAKHFPQLEIIELLGQGGMGAVYKARQKDLDRLVALKVLPGGAGSDPAFAERFTREARALARLNHPNIVGVHDFGQIQRGDGAPALLYYFIMEFVEGPNLRQLMHGRRLSPREAMSIVPRICEALQFAHDEGIVHRDIKPENILLDLKGRVKIADFGIAKLAGKGRDPALTGAKDVIGTPHYMAPEQVERPTEVDHRADIYSLGVVFYEMLTGELPLGKFAAPSRKVQVDVRLDEVVLHALEKEPDRRYQHASEVKTDVEMIGAGTLEAATNNQGTEGEAQRPEVARRTWQPGVATLLLMGCILLWGFMGYLTFFQPLLIERAAVLDHPLPGGIRLLFVLGNVAHHLGPLLIPLLVLATVGAFAWWIMTHAAGSGVIGRRAGAGWRRPAPGTATQDSRFSRLAIVGACWVPLFFITALMLLPARMVPVPDGGPAPGLTWWQVGLSLTLLPLGLTAPFGATICGVVALSQIRRSNGRLCGLGLALFDALLFPLLILDGLIVWLVYLLMCQSLEWVGFRPGTEVPLETAVLPAVLIILVADAWLVQWAWGSAKRVMGVVPATEIRHSTAAWTRVAVPVSLVLLLGAAALIIAAPLHSKRHLEEQMQSAQRRIGESRLRESLPEGEPPPTATAPGDPPPTAAAGSAEAPPVVVRTQPQAGSDSVDPSLTELRVTFSKPMQNGSWAWCKLDDESFPSMRGEPRYVEEGRTCVLPVRLEPGRTYAIWINVDDFQEFQDQAGNPAVPYLLVFRTRTGDAAKRVTVARDGTAQFTSVQEAIEAVAIGGTVEIGPGRYAERLEITKPVRLVGAGWNTTVIGPTHPWSPPSPEVMQEMQKRFEAARSDTERALLREGFTRQVQPPVVSIRNTRDVSLEGLQLAQPGVAPEGSLLSGATIEVQDAGFSMTACAVLGSPGSGVRLANGTSGDIHDCLIAAVWNRGVAIEDTSRVVIRDCDIRNCHYAGVTVGRGAEAVIEGCRISGAAWHGIRYDHASPRIEGNLIFRNARSGIYASGTTAAQVKRNVFFDNEMNGVSCWYHNQDRIEGNTFVRNRREALSILGASAPTIRSNIFSGHAVALYQGRIGGEPDSVALGRPVVLDNLFWNNATNRVQTTGRNAEGAWLSEPVALEDATRSRFEDPQFVDAAQGNFELTPGSPARRDGMGVASPIPLASPWPLQPEERAILPEDDTRDSRRWKRPAP